MSRNDAIQLTSLQRKLALVPDEFFIANCGGRGSSKSDGSNFLCFRHCAEYGEEAVVWIIRKSFPGMVDLERRLQRLVPILFPGARYNGARHEWLLPNGARIELGVLDSEGDFERWQGREATLIIIDEIQQFADPHLLDMLHSCLRGPARVPKRMIWNSNPGGAGAYWIHERFFSNGAGDGEPFTDSNGATWVRLHSTFRDNQFIDQEKYLVSLRAAAGGDEELAQMWIEGRFDVLRGSFFGGVLSFDRSSFHATPKDAQNWPVRWYVAHDDGTAAPDVNYLVVEVLEGFEGTNRWFPSGSKLLIDETHTARPDDWSRGLGLTVPERAARIRGMCAAWGLRECEGVSDPAIFAKHGHQAGSIADEFAANGVLFERGDNDRAAGWSRMRTLLSQAGSNDLPGLYVSTLCRGFWATVPSLPRSRRNPEDAETNAVDHFADAARYGVMYEQPDDEIVAIWL